MRRLRWLFPEKPLLFKKPKPSIPKGPADKEITLEKLKEDLPQDDPWFERCKASIKSIKSARQALKGLHQAGTNKKVIRKILPDITSAITKITSEKTDTEERISWKHALWRFVAQFSELNGAELVKIHDESVARAKLDKKDKKRRRDEKEKLIQKSQKSVDKDRDRDRDRDGDRDLSKKKMKRPRSPTFRKDDRKRKSFDKSSNRDEYGKKWRPDIDNSQRSTSH